jgi:hypothetical protein
LVRSITGVAAQRLAAAEAGELLRTMRAAVDARGHRGRGALGLGWW